MTNERVGKWKLDNGLRNNGIPIEVDANETSTTWSIRFSGQWLRCDFRPRAHRDPRRSPQVQTKRQDKLLFVGLHVLINLAEEVSTERKMASCAGTSTTACCRDCGCRGRCYCFCRDCCLLSSLGSFLSLQASVASSVPCLQQFFVERISVPSVLAARLYDDPGPRLQWYVYISWCWRVYANPLATKARRTESFAPLSRAERKAWFGHKQRFRLMNIMNETTATNLTTFNTGSNNGSANSNLTFTTSPTPATVGRCGRVWWSC